jgi:hypothetical protein
MDRVRSTRDEIARRVAALIEGLDLDSGHATGEPLE